jgi:transcriptional regulator with XRE-family HTH domain
MRFPYLAENLRLFRLAQRLTQQQLADRAGAGFSQWYISRLEQGLRPADEQHVAALAAALSVTVPALTRRARVIAGSRSASIAADLDAKNGECWIANRN